MLVCEKCGHPIILNKVIFDKKMFNVLKKIYDEEEEDTIDVSLYLELPYNKIHLIKYLEWFGLIETIGESKIIEYCKLTKLGILFLANKKNIPEYIYVTLNKVIQNKGKHIKAANFGYTPSEKLIKLANSYLI